MGRTWLIFEAILCLILPLSWLPPPFFAWYITIEREKHTGIVPIVPTFRTTKPSGHSSVQYSSAQPSYLPNPTWFPYYHGCFAHTIMLTAWFLAGSTLLFSDSTSLTTVVLDTMQYYHDYWIAPLKKPPHKMTFLRFCLIINTYTLSPDTAFLHGCALSCDNFRNVYQTLFKDIPYRCRSHLIYLIRQLFWQGMLAVKGT